MKTPREILLARHQAVEAKLDCIRREIVEMTHNQETKTRSRQEGFASWCLCCSQALCRKFWLELIWPCRRTWAGLAAVWVTLLVFNLTQAERVQTVVANSTTSPGELRLALLEQQHLLTELIGPTPPATPAEPPRRPPPQPRSERRASLMMV